MDRRTELLRAAAVVYARHGYRGSTTRRIAEEAHVNEVTIFRQFGSKDALLQEAIATCGGAPRVPDLPDVPEDPATELAAWGTVVLERIYGMRQLIRRCLSEQEEHPHMQVCGNDMHRGTSLVLRSYLVRLRERGLGDAEFDPQAACVMFMSALFSDAMSRDRVPDIFPSPASAAVERYTQLLLRSIGVDVHSSSLS